MKTDVVDVSETRKEIKIEIEATEVRAEFERVTEEYARAVNVPGFRKGHAPVAVVRTRYKKDIQGDVLKRLVPGAVEQAITESGLQVIGQPDVHLDNEGLEKFGQEVISLHAHVEVMPDVKLGEYKGIEAARRTRPVREEEVERVIENLREASASLQPVEDRASEEGDTVTADIQGRYVEPPSDEDINVEDVDIVLGGEGVLPDFNENLTGVREGDAKSFTVSYPADFNAQGLAGKTIEYTATVSAVRRKEVPDVDDEWVKSLGEEGVETVESLRERAGDDVRGSMLLERVAEAEGLEVSDEEVEAEIQAMAEGSRQSIEQVRAALTKQGGERSIADRLRNRKALDFIVTHANVREEEWREEALEEAKASTETDAQVEGEEGSATAAAAATGGTEEPGGESQGDEEAR